MSTRSSKGTVTVAVDAMGGDHGPQELVAGAVAAAREEDVRVILVGDQTSLERELARLQPGDLPVSIAHSEGVILETDQPIQAMRDKPRASVIEAAKLVQSGEANAMATVGSTGAAMAAATMVLGLLEGLDRPALGGPILAPLSDTSIIDLGSNVDCRPGQMLGYAAIGVAFARNIQGVQEPRVALLSIGSEEGKGNRQVREAYPLFKESGLNFVGNVEGLDLFLDKADVVVCDGFVGNVLLKFAEGMGSAIGRWLPEALKAHLPPGVTGSLGSLLEGVTNLAEVGGAPLFGVNGVVVIGHGRARAAGVGGVISMAKRVWESDLVEAMQRELGSLRSSVKE